MGFDPPKISLFVTPCHFLLAQKVTNPVSLREPNAAPHKANPPLAGQRGQRTFLLASATHFAL